MENFRLSEGRPKRVGAAFFSWNFSKCTYIRPHKTDHHENPECQREKSRIKEAGACGGASRTPEFYGGIFAKPRDDLHAVSLPGRQSVAFAAMYSALIVRPLKSVLYVITAREALRAAAGLKLRMLLERLNNPQTLLPQRRGRSPGGKDGKIDDFALPNGSPQKIARENIFENSPRKTFFRRQIANKKSGKQEHPTHQRDVFSPDIPA